MDGWVSLPPPSSSSTSTLLLLHFFSFLLTCVDPLMSFQVRTLCVHFSAACRARKEREKKREREKEKEKEKRREVTLARRSFRAGEAAAESSIRGCVCVYLS